VEDPDFGSTLPIPEISAESAFCISQPELRSRPLDNVPRRCRKPQDLDLRVFRLVTSSGRSNHSTGSFTVNGKSNLTSAAVKVAFAEVGAAMETACPAIWLMHR